MAHEGGGAQGPRSCPRNVPVKPHEHEYVHTNTNPSKAIERNDEAHESFSSALLD